jgi:hypothetical protein
MLQAACPTPLSLFRHDEDGPAATRHLKDAAKIRVADQEIKRGTKNPERKLKDKILPVSLIEYDIREGHYSSAFTASGDSDTAGELVAGGSAGGRGSVVVAGVVVLMF